MILKPEPPSTLWPHAIPAIHIIRAELNETPLEHAWDKPQTEYLLFQNLWSQVTTDGSRRLTKGYKTTNFLLFFFLTKSLILQFWRRKEAYRERKSKTLVETQTKTFCKPQILTEKRNLRSPKKRSDSGLCQVALGDWPRKDKAMGHPLLQHPQPHHIHILLPHDDHRWSGNARYLPTSNKKTA
jgi:hypothetical protein